MIVKELARYNIDIAALTETRLSGEGPLTENGMGYTFFWKGEKYEWGVCFNIFTELTKYLEQSQDISDRMFLRVFLSCNQSWGIYHFRTANTKVPKADKIPLLGDFNARASNDHEDWKTLGKQSLGKINCNGLYLHLSTEFELVICDSFFYQKGINLRNVSKMLIKTAWKVVTILNSM